MANEFIARTGLTVLQNGVKITGSSAVSGDITASGNIKATQFTGSFKGDGSLLTGLVTDLRISGSTGSDVVGLLTDDLTIVGSDGITTAVTNNTITAFLDTGSATFLGGVKKKLNTDSVVSSSVQIDVRNTTGISTIATTGSNTFTGVQTINDTTNSTTHTNGALVVAGGVGVTKDVHISGSLTVNGLLTVPSMSTQYVTSSQVNVGTSKILLNNDDLVRFSGISIFDSGSSSATASIYWDGQNHKFIYQNEGISSYAGGMFIAGPKNTGALGEEIGLVDHRVPVAHGDDHIDSRPESSSIRIEFPSRLTHIEAGLFVTGAVSSSVGFSGDGSNLTGIVTTLSVTGSQGGQGGINLKTQGLTVTGTNGIAATVSGQTLTIANPYFTTASVYSATGPTTNEVVLSLPTGSHDAAHFNYVIKDGTNYRTGVVMAVWDSTSVEFTDTSTSDIGNTSAASFAVDTNTSNVRLKFTVSSGTWTIKTATQLI